MQLTRRVKLSTIIGWCQCRVVLWNVTPYITVLQIILHLLRDHWAYSGIFEKGVLPLYTLEGVGTIANFIIAYEESE